MASYVGTSGSDTLTGTNDDDAFWGFEGDDTFNGGDGFDSVYYFFSFPPWFYGPNGVYADLAAGSGTDTFGDTDYYFSIEEVYGTPYDDTFIGDDNDNFFTGYYGADDYYGGSGVDTITYQIEYNASSTGVFVDLTNEFAVDGDGNFEVVVSIENVRGSPYDDVIIGSDQDGYIMGLAGADYLNGGDGVDLLRYDRDARYYEIPGDPNSRGLSGVTVNLAQGWARDGYGYMDTVLNFENVRGTQYGDVLIGDDGDNVLDGLDGNDEFRGLAGNDTINGGDGEDGIYYLQESGSFGAYVDLAAGSGTDTYGHTDRYTSIEEVFGSVHGDTIIGNDVGNFFMGYEGADDYYGGGGNDAVSYQFEYRDDNAGIYVNLGEEYAINGDGDVEALVSIEHIRGTAYADVIIGSDQDGYTMGLAGADYLDGGGGVDVLRYDRDARYREDPNDPNDTRGLSGVTVDLKAGFAIDGYGYTDEIANFENVRGTNFGDTIAGDRGDNILEGLGGDDTLSGDNGDDTLIGDSGYDTLFGGNGDDVLLGGSNDDDLDGGNGDDIIDGGEGSDTLTGGKGDDTFVLGDGVDWITDLAKGEKFDFSGLEGSDAARVTDIESDGVWEIQASTDAGGSWETFAQADALSGVASFDVLLDDGGWIVIEVG